MNPESGFVYNTEKSRFFVWVNGGAVGYGAMNEEDGEIRYESEAGFEKKGTKAILDEFSVE
jgi:hypothetical protein